MTMTVNDNLVPMTASIITIPMVITMIKSPTMTMSTTMTFIVSQSTAP